MPFKTLKFEFTEIVVPGVSGGQTGTRWNFPDLPKLRYTSLQAVESYVGDGMIPGDLTLTPLNNPVFPVEIIKSSYLVLYLNERQDVYRVPLITLHRTQSVSSTANTPIPFVRSLFEFAGQKVTWDKSYVELPTAPANTVNTSFAFGIYYA
jgi:hypothetical protein